MRAVRYLLRYDVNNNAGSPLQVVMGCPLALAAGEAVRFTSVHSFLRVANTSNQAVSVTVRRAQLVVGSAATTGVFVGWASRYLVSELWFGRQAAGSQTYGTVATEYVLRRDAVVAPSVFCVIDLEPPAGVTHKEVYVLARGEVWVPKTLAEYVLGVVV